MRSLQYFLVVFVVLDAVIAHDRPFDDEFSQSLVEKGKKQLSVRFDMIFEFSIS